MEKREIIVVGAGPAGLSCALELARSGRGVLVLEKNESVGEKVCAGGLSAKTLRLGIPEGLLERQFREMIMHYGRSRFVVSDSETLVATIDRKRFGEWQVEECRRAGAEVVFKCAVSEIREHSLIAGGEDVGFQFLVCADGSNSLGRHFLPARPAARRDASPKSRFLMTYQYHLPEERENLEVFFEPDVFGVGYCWFFPHRGWTAIGCGAPSGEMPSKQLRQNFSRWLAEQGIQCTGGDLRAAIVNLDYRGYRFGNTFLIGDAAGLASDVTGEGIYGAVVSGREIARLMSDENHDPEPLTHWLSVKETHRAVAEKMREERMGTFLRRRMVPVVGRLEWFQDKAKHLFIKSPAW
jgi:flavin-dependent dehydrogenase